MTIWVDAQLSPSLAKWITETLGVSASAVRELGLRDAKDFEIFQSARVADAVVLTKDADFPYLLAQHGPTREHLEYLRRQKDCQGLPKCKQEAPAAFFDARINWQEKHKLLKVNFPVTVHSEDALHDIQFGHVRRPTHDSMEYDASRFEGCNHKWTAMTTVNMLEAKQGVAKLKDGKIALDLRPFEIRTLRFSRG